MIFSNNVCEFLCNNFDEKFDHCGMWIWWFMFNFFHEKRKLCSLPLKRKGLTIIFQLKFTSTTLPLHKEQNNFHKWQILTLYFSLKIHILKSTFLLILEHSKSEICLFTNWFCSPCIWWQPRTFIRKFFYFPLFSSIISPEGSLYSSSGTSFLMTKKDLFLGLEAKVLQVSTLSSRQSISGLGRLGARADLQIIFYKINF